MRKQKLISLVWQRVTDGSKGSGDVKRQDVEAVIDALLEVLTEHMAIFGKVVINRFGVFSVRPIGRRVYRNVHTGQLEKSENTGAITVRFRPHKTLLLNIQEVKDESADEQVSPVWRTPEE